MKDNLLAWLLGTGLDEQRAKLYLAALSRPEATAADLAKTLKLGRTAIYDNLRVLEERGFVKTVRHGKRKVFVPLHPKELLRSWESKKQQLKDLLPDFLALYATEHAQPFVQMFSGHFAAREVYEDILASTKQEYVYFSPAELTLQTVDHAYMKKWIERRVAKGIHVRSLRVKPKSEDVDPFFAKQAEHLRQIRYLHGFVDLRASIYIYENNIGVIATRKEGAAFIIHSPDLAFSVRQLFDFIWDLSLAS